MAATTPKIRPRVRPPPAPRRAEARPGRRSRLSEWPDRAAPQSAGAVPPSLILFDEPENACDLFQPAVWVPAPARPGASVGRSRNTPSGNAFTISSRTQRWAAPDPFSRSSGTATGSPPARIPGLASDFQRLAHRPCGVHDLFVVSQRDALQIDRRLQRREQLANLKRIAFVPRRCGRTARSSSSAPAASSAPSVRRSSRRSRC